VRDRKKRKGGGVCIYVRNNLQSYKFYAIEEFEIMWVKVCCQDNCYFIASCYHPPKPRYSVTDFVGQLCSTIESVIDCETNPIFLITVDFNFLATDFLEEEFGLSQLVQQSTHVIICLIRLLRTVLICFTQLSNAVYLKLSTWLLLLLL